MIKIRLALIFVVFSLVLCGQETDSLGIDNDSHLNNQEAVWLNVRLADLNVHLGDRRKDFDFKGKRVAFIAGGSGGWILTKGEYFKRPRHFSMQPLSESEKRESGGYDAFVFSGVKLFTSRQKRKTIERLRGDQ